MGELENLKRIIENVKDHHAGTTKLNKYSAEGKVTYKWDVLHCVHCLTEWPCETVLILDDEMIIEND